MFKNITDVADLKRVKNVFAERLKQSSPFSTDAATIQGLRAFFMPKITGSKRFFPVSLRRWIENEYQEKQALPAPATCTMINGLHKRVMAFFASCEHFRYSKRFDCWNENRSILILYMGSGLGHGERCSYVQN